MIALGKYPFLRIFIPFAIGVWCYLSLSFCLPLPAVWLMSLVLLLFSLAVSRWVKSIRLSWVFGVVMSLLLLFVGYGTAYVHDVRSAKQYYRQFEEDARYYVARVYDVPSERTNSYKVTLDLTCQVEDSGVRRPVSGKVLAYLPKPEREFPLRYGDVIAFPAPVPATKGPLNPEEFDYGGYLARKGITGQLYLNDGDWVELHQNEANPIYAFSYHFRDILLASLQRCGLHGDEFGVAAAILLGYDEDLSAEMRERYVAAGSMHILCVSGLHVGIIYLLASTLLGFLNRKRWQKVLKHFLLLALIWFYALIAGLSPSIVRASLMISFVLFGEMLHRKGAIINSVAASAFLLLLFDPAVLFNMGFQLSYAAVVGIVVLQKPIYGLLYFKNKLLDKAWEITAVALAAQFATLPFTLYYFGRFSVYFWLSNLIMTPVSFVVIIAGMLLLMVSWIPGLNMLMGYLVWGAVFVMNTAVSWIEQLPGSVLNGLYVNKLEFVVLLALLLAILLLVTTERRAFVPVALALVLLFALSVTTRHYRAERQQEMLVYSLRKHTAVDVIQGHSHLLIGDSLLMGDTSAVDYSLKGYWMSRMLSQNPDFVGLHDDFENAFVRKKDNLMSFHGKLMAFCDVPARVSDSLATYLPVDYLLVCSRQKPDLSSLSKVYRIDTLLIDGSVPVYLAEKWKTEADTLQIPCYYVGEGAFKAEW